MGGSGRMSAWTRAVARAAAGVWAGIRAVSGDDAYEAYLSRRSVPGAAPTREQFYLERLRRR
ncbi:MAG: hypothetical protein DMF81_24655 [Acidobacteria bacterium]|nr:MAG: hypothetical protein DMF81_24655 [Acidobacteriota bacterium]